MTADHDTLLIRSWLRDGPTELPDRVLDAVIAQLPETRQRRATATARRRRRADRRGSLLLVAAAAAIVVAAAIDLVALRRPGVPDGGPFASPAVAAPPTTARPATPEPSFTVPSPTPTATAGPSTASPGPGPAATPAGTADRTFASPGAFPVRFSLRLEDRWVHLKPRLPRGFMGAPPSLARPDPAKELQLVRSRSGGATMSVTFADTLRARPCDDHEPMSPAVGSTARDLALALAGLPRLSGTGPEDARIGGRRGYVVSFATPAGVPPCVVWTGRSTLVVDPGEQARAWIVDVGRERLVIVARVSADSPPDLLDEMTRMVESIRFGD